MSEKTDIVIRLYKKEGFIPITGVILSQVDCLGDFLR